MQTNTTYAIYWSPSGFSDPSYESLISRYLGDVAAASGSPSNVYSVAGQYYDSNGAIRYKSTFGGSYVDTDPFPASGCGQASVCLTDAQLQAEIQTVLTHQGWHGGTSNMFFLFTPNGVASCTDSSDSVCSTNVFCAYHSDFFDSNGEDVITDEPHAGRSRAARSRSWGTRASRTTRRGRDDQHGQPRAQQGAISIHSATAGGQPTSTTTRSPTFAGDFGSTPLGTTTGALQPAHQRPPVFAQEEYITTTQLLRSGLHADGGASTFAPGAQRHSRGRAFRRRTAPWTRPRRNTAPHAYQWQRCEASGTGCTAISGATAATYLPHRGGH
jgi:hypothetical protein